MIKLIIGSFGILLILGLMTYAMILDIGIIGALIVWGLVVFVCGSAFLLVDGFFEVFR